MICFWQSVCFVLLSIGYSWSVTQSKYVPNLNALKNSYKAGFSFFTGAPSYNNPLFMPEYSLEMTKTNKYGLPKCAKQKNECRQIGIVGAGAAGLYCGILLAEAGHTVTIYEASNRAGGRVFTYRNPINPSVYMGELGAMRFPLDNHPYLDNLIRQRYKLNITEFVNNNENAYAYINGIFATFRKARENPDIFKFNTSQNERGKTPADLMFDGLQPFLETLSEGGWPEVLNKWDSYSIESYLNEINMSRAAIDYIGAFESFEASFHLAAVQAFYMALTSNFSSKYYRIEGGNDLLIRAMVDECQAIESNRCSIVYSTLINQIQLHDSNQIQLTTKNGTTDTFDTIVVATTATAAQLIDFDRRTDFVDKYRVLRQLHYSCATKILLSFNVSWWYTQEHLNGGHSTTDLPIRNVYYPTTNNNLTNGGTILASYVHNQDSLIWQSLSDSDVFELALKQLIQLHRSSSNMRDYFQGGKIQHWCGDPYSHGAFASFLPLQQTKLFDQLQTPVSNIHFIGEYTTLIHGWVEGALASAVRAALAITTPMETMFDVIIVGGGPVGLTTAVFLSLKQPNLRIGIIEKGTVSTSDGSLGTFDQRHFRQMYDEEYLAELVNMSFPLWRQIEELANLSPGSILNTSDGFLFFGDIFTNQSTVEGNLASIKRTCESLQMNCEYLNNTQLRTKYPIFTFPPQYQGIFHSQSGYINVTTLMIALLRIIDQNPNIIIRQREDFLSLNLLDNQTQIVTDRGVLYAARKVLFIPGPYVKNTSRLLNFDLNVTLWELPIYYFRRLSNVSRVPNWVTLGDHHPQSLFSGFSIDSGSDYIVIIPNFIENMSNPLIYPSQRTNRINPFLSRKVIEWISDHLGNVVNVSDYYSNNETCLATFLPDNGFLLDYIPRTNKRVLMQAAGWGMKFVPIWADILSDMALSEANPSSQYAKYMDYLSLSRPNRLIEEVSIISNRGYQFTYSFSLLWCFILIIDTGKNFHS